MNGRFVLPIRFAILRPAFRKASTCWALVMLALVKKKAATPAFRIAAFSSSFRLIALSLLTMTQLLMPQAAIQTGSSVSESKWSSCLSTFRPKARNPSTSSYLPDDRSTKNVVSLSCSENDVFVLECFFDLRFRDVIVACDSS